MVSNEAQQLYRKSAIQGASPIGLVIALYDRLSADLRRAAEAIRNHDIEGRCAALNHASAVLGHLESWIDARTDNNLAESLSLFYCYLRTRMMEAALQQSAALLEEQIYLILQVRAAWQQRDGVLTDWLARTADVDAEPSTGSMRSIFSQSA
jgi:flagellar protein FliS